MKKDNLGLWLARFLHRKYDGDYERWTLDGKALPKILDEFRGAWTVDAGNDALERRKEGCRLVKPGAFSSREESDLPLLMLVTRALAGRLAVGAGSASATEVSLTFHHIWGVPIVPGSSLKGLALSQARLEGWPADRLFKVFGTQEQGGWISFLDAMPEGGRFVLETDVLTPHFKPWYEGTVSGPYEWFNPVPLHVLTVVRTKFVFDLMWIGPQFADDEGDSPERLIEDTGALLARGLFEQGIGGKTAVGYGIFEEA